MSYKSPDPVLAAKDELSDAKAARRAAYWYFVWRIGLHLLILGLGVFFIWTKAEWGWFTVTGVDGHDDEGGIITLFTLFTQAPAHLITAFAVWPDRKRWLPSVDHKAVRNARRKVRDVKAARKTANNESVRAKAEEMAAAKIAEKMVAEWSPPEGWTPK